MVASIFESVPVGRHLRFHRDGNKYFWDLTDLDATKTGTGYSNHRQENPIYDKLLVQDGRVGSEVPGPVAIAQHRHLICPRCSFVLGGEDAPEHRIHAEHLKIVARHQFTSHTFGLTVSGHAEGKRITGNHAGKDLISITQVLIHRIGKCAALQPIAPGVSSSCSRRAQNHQFLRMGDRQQPQKNLVSEGEDRGVGADAKRQRDYGYGRESGSLPQLAKSVANILEETGHSRIYSSTRIAAPPWDRPKPHGARAPGQIVFRQETAPLPKQRSRRSPWLR